MEDRQDFDMRHYIEKRMLEIKNLGDRMLFKEAVGEILLSVYEYTGRLMRNWKRGYWMNADRRRAVMRFIHL